MSFIRVFHYEDGSSDKVWAIEEKLNSNGKYNVWYGARDKKLRADEVPTSTNSFKRICQKEAKGYVEKSDWTIKDGTLVWADQDDDQDEFIPSSLWFRIVKDVDSATVAKAVLKIAHNLDMYDPDMGESLRVSHVFKSIMDNNRNGGVELEDGPVSVLFLYALRRELSGEIEHLFTQGDLLHIADDDNNIIPDRFDDCEEYIVGATKAMLMKEGFIFPGDVDADVEEACKRANTEHLQSMSSMKPLAIAMGCIDAPIDLTVIQTETQSAFF